MSVAPCLLAYPSPNRPFNRPLNRCTDLPWLPAALPRMDPRMTCEPLAVDKLASLHPPDGQTMAQASASPHVPAYTTRLALEVFGPHETPNGFQALADEWNDLVSRSRSDTFFLTYEWQTIWWEQLGKGELWILSFRCPDTGMLVGIAPLYRTWQPEPEGAESQGRWQFNIVGCIEVSDYLDLITATGWETEVYLALRAWLESDESPAWSVLDLCNLPEVSLTYKLVPEIFGDSYQVTVFQEDVAPSIHLPHTYDAYLMDQVEKKQRHEIRRKQRRAEREATVGFYMVDARHDLDAEVDDFIRLQMLSDPEKANFMTTEMKRFFRAVAHRMLESGHLRLFFLTLDGYKSSTLYAFEYNRRLLLYNSGYDPKEYANLSPGWVLLAYAIQYAVAIGSEQFDFMQGDEEYKFRFGARGHSVMRVIVRRC